MPQILQTRTLNLNFDFEPTDLHYTFYDSNTDVLFTVADSYSFLSPREILPIAQKFRRKKVAVFPLTIC